MIPVEQQQDPRNDIGPIYKILGAVALGFAFLVVGFQAMKGHFVGLHDVVLIGICALLCLALWRPASFDAAIKVLADHLPTFSFSRREVTAQETAEHSTSGE